MPGKAIASFFSIWRSWWQRRVSLAISVGITIFAIFIYVFTFVGERPTPIFEFVQRQELNALDTRFRYRPLRYTRPDPRIIIVDIDQHSQEVHSTHASVTARSAIPAPIPASLSWISTSTRRRF